MEEEEPKRLSLPSMHFGAQGQLNSSAVATSTVVLWMSRQDIPSFPTVHRLPRVEQAGNKWLCGSRYLLHLGKTRCRGNFFCARRKMMIKASSSEAVGTAAFQIHLD